MSNKLNLSTSEFISFRDETLSLEELIKNPFDEAFKKATENEYLLELGDGAMISTDTLNTPNPLISNSPIILNLLNEESISRDVIKSDKNIQSYQFSNIPKKSQLVKKIVSIRPAPSIPQTNICKNISINNNTDLSQSNFQYVPIYVTALHLPALPNVENNTSLPNILPNGTKDIKQILKERIHSTKLRKSMFPNMYFPSPNSIKTGRNEKYLQSRKEESNSRKEILEKNREASARCRFKKKIQLQNMAKLLFDVQKQNRIFQKEIKKLKKINEELLNDNVILKNIRSSEFL